VTNKQVSQGDEVAGAQTPLSGQRQPAGKSRSPSVGTAPSSASSERPYAGTLSKSSSVSGERPPESDSRGSSTLNNTASSAHGERPTAADGSISQSPSVAGRRQPASRARSSTSGHTAVSSDSFVPAEGGFPTFGDTEWGDPIAAAQYQRRKSARSGAGKKGTDGASDDVETENKSNEGEQDTRPAGKKYRGWTKGRGGKAKAKRGGAPQADDDSLSRMLDLPPGGPSSSWGDPEAEW
jgi:hypothetical protein